MSLQHHFLVHFPVALLLVAGLADLIGVMLKRPNFTQMAFAMLMLGALGAIAAAVSGNGAEANLLSQEMIAIQVVDEMIAHTNWGNIMVWVILIVACGRAFAFLEKKPWATAGWLFPALTSLLAIAVIYTGWLGGKLSEAMFNYLKTLI